MRVSFGVNLHIFYSASFNIPLGYFVTSILSHLVVRFIRY